jgi:hypothetical protein
VAWLAAKHPAESSNVKLSTAFSIKEWSQFSTTFCGGCEEYRGIPGIFGQDTVPSVEVGANSEEAHKLGKHLQSNNRRRYQEV